MCTYFKKKYMYIYSIHIIDTPTIKSLQPLTLTIFSECPSSCFHLHIGSFNIQPSCLKSCCYSNSIWLCRPTLIWWLFDDTFSKETSSGFRFSLVGKPRWFEGSYFWDHVSLCDFLRFQHQHLQSSWVNFLPLREPTLPTKRSGSLHSVTTVLCWISSHKTLVSKVTIMINDP